jgi:hypothetical protein
MLARTHRRNENAGPIMIIHYSCCVRAAVSTPHTLTKPNQPPDADAITAVFTRPEEAFNEAADGRAKKNYLQRCGF